MADSLKKQTQGDTIKPKELLDFCKNHSEMASFLPLKLIEVINNFGPHPSLNLPSSFSSLEIDPSTLRNLKKFKERQKTPPPILNTE